MTDPSVRASDADREVVAAALREHLLAGRIPWTSSRSASAPPSRPPWSVTSPVSRLICPNRMSKSTRRRRSRERDRRRRAKADRQQGKSLASWQARRDAQAELLRLAREFRGATASGFICGPGEAVFAAVTGSALIEYRRQPGQYQGRSSSVSLRLGPVGTRSGASRGRYVQGPETATAIDTGTLYITNKRVVFQGSKQTRECRYDKTIGISRDDRHGTAVISVSNRQKPMMVRYGRKQAGAVATRMELALAHYRGQLPALVARLERELAAIDQTKPGTPGAARDRQVVGGAPPTDANGARVAKLRNAIEELDAAMIGLLRASEGLHEVAAKLASQSTQAAARGTRIWRGRRCRVGTGSQSS